MGFFSDLKEDLSQAVNELMPEETNEETVQTPEEDEELKELAAMLDKLEQEDATEAAQQDITEEEVSEENEIISDAMPEDELAEIVDVAEVETVAVEPENKYDTKGDMRMSEQIFGANEVATDEKSIITEGMTINGDIASRGSMDVLGNIIGNIDVLGKLDVSGTIQGNSKAAEIYAENAKIVGEVHSLGSVKIGQSTVIIGDISATSAVIAGAIKGDIDVKGPVILDTSAIVMGNIKSKSVQINNGAVVEGLCSQCYADVNPSAFFDEFKKTAKA